MYCKKCNNVINPEHIEYSNGTNEEGEEYAIVEYVCFDCWSDYEYSQWGHLENPTEAIQLFTEKFLEDGTDPGNI